MVPVMDNDINLSYSNPSLLNASMNDRLALNYSRYFADIDYGSVEYARQYRKNGMLSAAVNYINYGNFTGADETGNVTGAFNAREYVVQLSCSQQIDSFFTFGSTIKYIGSVLETYRSSGLAADLGISYNNIPHILTASLVLKNLGRQLKTFYNGGETEPLPFELQFGISKKLAHAPFRFLLVAQHLEKFDMTYENPNDPSEPVDPVSGEKIKESTIRDITDKALRHLIVGAEFIPSQNFFVDISYNFQRGKEMKIETKPGFVGFSWGIGIRISKFSFSFARSTYHLAGSTNHFSISTCPGNFFKQRAIL
jgi:hypothetical protein